MSRDEAFEKGLCLGCYQPGHIHRDCPTNPLGTSGASASRSGGGASRGPGGGVNRRDKKSNGHNTNQANKVTPSDAASVCGEKCTPTA